MTNKPKNAKLIDPDLGHFRVMNFINVYLSVPVLWQSIDYDSDGNKGVTFNAYEDEINPETCIGYIMIVDTTEDKTELDVTKMTDIENHEYNKYLEGVYKEAWKDELVSWDGYEISETNQGNVSFLTKCVINEYGAGKKFDFSMRTTFKSRTIFASAAVRENNLNFLKYYKHLKEVVDNITFEEF